MKASQIAKVTEIVTRSKGNELLIDLDANKGITPVDTWFDQDVFAGNMVGDRSSDQSSESSDADDEYDQSEDAAVASREASESESESDNGSVEENMGAQGNGTGVPRDTGSAGGFEEVPMSEDDSDSAAEEFDMLTDDAKAEVLALAKKFISKKSKSELLVRVLSLVLPLSPSPVLPTPT